MGEEEWVTHEYVITTQSLLYAPFLSDLKFSKQRQLELLVECYKSDIKDPKELEKIKHLDRAFDRITWYEDNKLQCQPIIAGHVLSQVLREVLNDNTVTVRGYMQIPIDRLIIDMRRRNNATEISEAVLPATTMSAVVAINKKVEVKDKIAVIGAKKYKGYGQVRLTVRPLNLKRGETMK